MAVRLSARLLSAGSPANWRGWAARLAGRHPPYSDAARHYRRTAGAADPSGPVVLLTESAAGVRELALGASETVPGSAPLVDRVRAALNAALPGWAVRGPGVDTLDGAAGVPDDDPLTYFDSEYDEWPSPSPAASPPPTT